MRRLSSQASTRCSPTVQSRTSSDRAVPLPALASSSDQTPIAQLGVPSATAKTSAAVNWTRLENVERQDQIDQWKSPNSTFGRDADHSRACHCSHRNNDCADCQRLPTRGPANDEARAPTRVTKVTNIAVWRNHARSSLRMSGLRNWAEPRGPTTDRRDATETTSRASLAMRPIEPVRLAVQEEELDVAFT